MSGLFATLFWSCLVLYAVVVAMQLYGRIFDRPRMVELAPYGVGIGFVVHTVLVAWRWIATGHVPTIGNFENALMGGWFIVAMTLWSTWRERNAILPAATLPFALIILGGGAMSETAEQPMLASLKSFWLYIHIFFAWLAYGAYTVACGAGILYLSRSSKDEEHASLGRLDELMFRATVFGFITDAIMIAAGSIWAKDLWGSYWSWDPVETWSLLSWLIYGVALHLRITLHWRGRMLAWILVFAILGVLISFWGVNLVMGGTQHVFNAGPIPADAP